MRQQAFPHSTDFFLIIHDNYQLIPVRFTTQRSQIPLKHLLQNPLLKIPRPLLTSLLLVVHVKLLEKLDICFEVNVLCSVERSPLDELERETDSTS